MSRTTFTIILSILTLAATGCSKKPQNIETISNTDKPVAEIPNIDNIPFEERKPFKYTVTTDIETEDGDDVIVTVYADSLDHKYEVKYDLDCEGDGEYEYTGLTKLSFCHYAPGSGTHQIWVRGEIPAICLCSLSCANSSFRSVSKINSQSVISVDEWGDVAWKSMVGFAAFCNNLNQLPDDVPILYYVKDLSSMFEKAASFNQPLEHWDVSGVTNMEMMLSNAKSFNQPLEKWNVSNVTNMSWMFNDAESFNQPLEKWNVSNVKNMSFMFSGAVSFNQPLEKWNVSNVTDMSDLFSGAESFNQPLEKWDVSNVTDMSSMFDDAYSFNQPLEKWDVSNVTNMMNMFSGADSFNQPLDRWDISNIKNIDYIFAFAKSYEYYPESWIIPEGVSVVEMFEGTKVEELSKKKPLKRRKAK